MFLARWNPAAATLEYASAGHETAWLLPAAGSLRELSSTGLPLAVQDDAVWSTVTLSVAARDRLLLVSDGITEAFNGQGEQSGRDRLSRVFENCRSLSVDETVRAIEDAVTAHRQGKAPTDDSTLVAVQFVGEERPITSTKE